MTVFPNVCLTGIYTYFPIHRDEKAMMDVSIISSSLTVWIRKEDGPNGRFVITFANITKELTLKTVRL